MSRSFASTRWITSSRLMVRVAVNAVRARALPAVSGEAGAAKRGRSTHECPFDFARMPVNGEKADAQVRKLKPRPLASNGAGLVEIQPACALAADRGRDQAGANASTGANATDPRNTE